MFVSSLCNIIKRKLALATFLCFMAQGGAGSLYAAESLFADPTVARASGFEIKESNIQDAFTAYKAARAALGQPLPSGLDAQARKQILEKLIATKLLLARATPSDKEEGKKMAGRLIAEMKSRARGESSYQRQMLAMGTTAEKYEADILEQAVVKAVIDRELKTKVVIGDAEMRKFYEENRSLFEEPEKVKVAHILIATRKIPSGEPLPLAQRQAKLKQAKRVLDRAKGGEEFDKLIAAFSEEPAAGDQKQGELTVARGGKNAPTSFQVAAFSLTPGQISDIVESPLGYHIIKLLEKTPASAPPLEKVQDQIRNVLQEREVQKEFPSFMEKLRKEAGVEILEG